MGSKKEKRWRIKGKGGIGATERTDEDAATFAAVRRETVPLLVKAGDDAGYALKRAA